ncbi:Oxygen-independent coproporphyrinogen-III oxidase-like protein YqeR [Thalassocella blandensis]|nr:Oxygen-independent coproporphyrinogen-III oxidase-like protein YqeR [Thalassocella blandensis]
MRPSQEILRLPPLSLYIHIPWCIKKCPYCDFNSHAGKAEQLPIEEYCKALRQDLTEDAKWAQGRKIQSIFFGGGTPSLFPPAAIAEILSDVDHIVGIEEHAEITLEANPGTTEYTSFRALRQAGVNRLSIGIQSFNPEHLQKLGRIHSANEAETAIHRAQEEGFDNINLDLMHGLPQQTVAMALDDLEKAMSFRPNHLSWYQLTIEKNTEFFSRPPSLPEEDILVDIFEAGQQALFQQGYQQYEISAYSKAGKMSAHNINYWQFGDYLAIGAGAHGKITLDDQQQIMRFQKTRLPQHYLDPARQFTAQQHICDSENLVLEFMMNALRLNDGVASELFQQRTGLALETILPTLQQLHAKGLLESPAQRIQPSALGRLYLNNLLESFVQN